MVIEFLLARLTRQSRFPLTALATRARALPQGASGSLLCAPEQDMRLRRRDALQRPGLINSPLNEGGWRAEKRKPMVSALSEERRAPLGAPITASIGVGPRFIPDQVKVGDCKPAPGRFS
jgi:hypothetical protein